MGKSDAGIPQKSQITVPLDDSSRARSFAADHTFFKPEIDRVLAILERDIGSLPGRPGEGDPREDDMLNARDVICVYGSRGAGKTSFLRSVGAELHKDKKVHVLPLLDPTLIERNEVFLATIVSNVLAAIERRSRPHRATSPLADDALAHDEQLRAALDALARAFRLLAPGGIASAWGEAMADPHLFAHEVLQDAASGRELALRFHRFIGQAARVVGVEAFVQPLDDVDTAYGQGWHVLETTRKYLSTRLFIPMISGDLDLYRMLVRANQLEHVRPILEFERQVTGEGPRADLRRYQRQVDQLEEQYLLKVMPAERRVRLRPVRDRIWKRARERDDLLVLESARLRADPSGAAAQRPLSAVFAAFCRDAFGWRRRKPSDGASEAPVLDPEVWPVARLLPARTRSLISLFEVLVDHVAPDASKGAASSPAEGLSRIFRQALITRDIDDALLDHLAEGRSFGRLGAWALHWRSEVSQLHLLDPERLRDLSDVEEWTQTALTLNAALYQRWRRDPGSALRFGAKVVLPSLMTQGSRIGTSELEERIALEANEPSRHTATRLQALAVGAGNDPKRRTPGLIWLPRRKIGDHDNHVVSAWARYVKARGYEKKGDHRAEDIDLLPLLAAVKEAIGSDEAKTKKPEELAQVLFVSWPTFRNKVDANVRLILDWFGLTLTLSGGAQLTYLSVDRGLAALGDLLDRATRADSAPGADARRAEITEIVSHVLREAGSFAPSLGNTSEEQGMEDTDEDPQSEGSAGDDRTVDLTNALVEWALAVAQSKPEHLTLALPPYAFARALARWWSNVEKLNDKDSIAFRTAGGMLHRWLAAFLHAHLIEEITLLGPAPSGFHSNAPDVVLTTTSFEGNLTAALELAASDDPGPRPTATAVWMACPLILACLAPGLRSRVCALARRVLVGKEGREVDDPWRAYFQEALRPREGKTAEDEPASTTGDTGQSTATASDGASSDIDPLPLPARLARPQLTVAADIHVLLTALYAPEAGTFKPIPPSTYQSLRTRLSDLSGLSLDHIEQQKK
ncbi:MAG: hypothetical protein R3F65_19620 [bacterium]